MAPRVLGPTTYHHDTYKNCNSLVNKYPTCKTELFSTWLFTSLDFFSLLRSPRRGVKMTAFHHSLFERLFWELPGCFFIQTMAAEAEPCRLHLVRRKCKQQILLTAFICLHFHFSRKVGRILQFWYNWNTNKIDSFRVCSFFVLFFYTQFTKIR